MSNFRIYNDALCQDLWDKNSHLNPQIRTNLLQMAYDFYAKTKLLSPIVDVYLMGSGANYNWTPESDVDVHIIIDYSKLQMPIETAIKTVKIAGAQWNSEHNIFIKGHKVEMNLQNFSKSTPYVTGIYSLIRDQWLRQPSKISVQIDKPILKFQYEAMKKYIQNCIGSGDREQMNAAKKYLDAYRQYGLDTHGELSYENIIYKMLRARGYIKQLKDSIVTVYDQQMTVDEMDSNDIRRTHYYDQLQGAIQAKVDTGMELWKQSGLKVGDILYTPKGTMVTVCSSGIRINKQGEPIVHVKYVNGEDEIQSGMYLNKLQYDNPIKNEGVGHKINLVVNEFSINENSDYDAVEDHMERRDKQLYEIAVFLKTHPKSQPIPWNTISSSLLKKVWLLFGKYNKIHEDGLDKIADRILTNIVRLGIANEFTGHSENYHLREEIFDNCDIEFTDKQWEDNTWRFCDKNGVDYISDYGIEPLQNVYVIIFNAKTPEEKMYACDKALNVVHQRSDLASMFVEGGTTTLNQIANQGGYNANYEFGQVNREFRNKDIREGVGTGIPEDDRLKIKNTDGSTRRWQVRSKDAPKTPKMPTEDIQRMGSSTPTSPMNVRTKLFPTPVETEIEPRIQKIISTAEKVLDKRSTTHPFFEIEYVEDLVGDIVAIDFPSAPSDRVKYIVSVIVQWIARDYDIRKNGTRIGESLSKKTPLYESTLRGEWWFQDGQAVYADGDTGDMNHEAFVIDSLRRQIIDELGADADGLDYVGDFDAVADDIFNSIGDEFTPEEKEQWSNEQYTSVIWSYLKRTGNKNLLEKMAYAFSNTHDPREYALIHWKWQRVKGNNIQTQTLTEQDLKNIVRGLSDAYGDDINDENEDPSFNIEVMSTRSWYSDIPMSVLEKKSVTALNAYRTRY